MMAQQQRGRPTYNLKVVVQETGIKPDTLRAWERRYGLPRPSRTAGGHRLYTERDILTVKWLKARQAEGLSISRAVNLWLQFEEAGQDPLLEIPLFEAGPATRTDLAAGATMAGLRHAWLSACLAFDEPSAEQALAQAFALYPAETVCVDLIQRAMATIGDLWYEGQATVQQEHFASALALRKIDTLIAAAPAAIRPQHLLVGCPPGEEHSFPLLLITLLLRRHGWPVVYLGANVPRERLQLTLDTVKPHLVILAAQQLYTAATLADTAEMLATAGIPLAFGGGLFHRMPAVSRRIAGHYLGSYISEIVGRVQQILTAWPATPAVEPPPARYQVARRHFQERQPAIEALVWNQLSGQGIDPEHLDTANHYLAKDILAALKLGDMDFMTAEMAWLARLLVNYAISGDLLDQYLDSYRQAARSYLDDRAQPILEWLDGVGPALQILEK